MNSHHTRITSRWIKDLNISCDTIKALEDNIGRKISDIPCSNIFTDMSSRARDIKERINKWDLIKIKSIWMAKENISKMKREPNIWENHMTMIPRTKVWSPKYIKNSHDSTPGRQTTQLKNGQRTWTVTSPRKTHAEPRDMWKDAQHYCPSERCRLKPQWDATFTPVRMAIINKSTRNNKKK